MQSMMLKCGDGVGDDLAAFSFYHQLHFPHLDHFPEKFEARKSIFSLFFFGQQKFYSCQKTGR